MLRAGAILLASLMLLQSLHISVSDLVQMDELLEHARYHKQQFGDDFISFISKHYGAEKQEHDQQHQEERPQHDQLPFQQLLQSGIVHTFFFTDSMQVLIPPTGESKNQPADHYLPSRGSGFQSGIFQPPRLG